MSKAIVICYTQYLICVHLISALRTIPVVEILEEAAAGTVIIDNLFHRLQLLQGINSQNLYAAIGNPSSPGIANLEIRPDNFGSALQLVVRSGHRGPDRETLCDSRNPQSNSHMSACDIALVILHGDRRNPSYAKVNLRILDINDNAPSFLADNRLDLAVTEDFDLSETIGQTSNYPTNFAKTNKPTQLIPLPAAVDLDLAENGVKYYRLTTLEGSEIDDSMFMLLNNESDHARANHYSENQHFSLTPILRITGRLDREQKSVHWFHLLAIDNGVPQLTGTLTVRLSVTDVNDNKPAFRKPIFHQPTIQMLTELNGRSTNREVIRIPETLPVGSELVTLVADDKDEGQNAVLEYRLWGSSGTKADSIGARWFGLNTKNNSVTLKVDAPLDADIPQSKLWMHNDGEVFGYFMQVTIEARDAGIPPLTTTFTLLLLIENINDNRPEITIQFTNPLIFNRDSLTHIDNESFAGSVQENFNGAFTVAHLTVIDKDLVNPASVPSNNLIIRDDIHCETNDTRFALDRLPSMSLFGLADGLDSGRPSRLSYFYRMTALKEFDREVSEWIYVHVTCIDQAEPHQVRFLQPQGKHSNTFSSLAGSFSVLLKITDVNDNAPKFTKDFYHFSVLETPGNPTSFDINPAMDDSWTLVGQVQATDADSGENKAVRYNLLTNPYNAFRIDSVKGSITRVGPLDRETDAKIELNVEARDLGVPALSTTCKVLVDIVDVNDHPPYWVTGFSEANDYYPSRSEDSVFYFSIAEDAEVGQLVGSIKAIDLDGTTQNGLLQLPSKTDDKEMRVKDESRIIYQLESIEDAIVYSISRRTGEIHLSRRLDRETRTHYEIRAFAIDNPSAEGLTGYSRIASRQRLETMNNIQYTATATIIITVLDVNDNYPQFESPLAGQEFHIDLNSPLLTPGTTLFTAKAHDADSGENATVHYALEGSGYGLVEIDPTTGVCYIREALMPSTIMRILSNNKIPFTEQVNSVEQLPNNNQEQTNAFKLSSEMRIVSLSLVVVAYDLGRPKRLNSSRVVRLIWNGQGASDMRSTYPSSVLLGGPYAPNFLFSSKLSTTERILIPLVGCAFLLLIFVCAVLFGVSHHRKRTKNMSAASYATTHSSPQQAERHVLWDRWCCCATARNKETTSTHRYETQYTKENTEDTRCINNKLIQSKHFILAKHSTPAETKQPYLPDCVPVHDVNLFSTGQQNTVGRLLATPPRIQKSDLVGQAPARGVRRLSRAYSEESLSLMRESDFGYSALRPYPTMMPGTMARFSPIKDEMRTETAHTDNPRQGILQTILFDQHNLCRPNSKTTRSKNNRASTASFYSPLSVATTAQLTYPTFQSICYGQTPMDSDHDHSEQFELGSKDVSNNDPNVGGGWKIKFTDAYTENSFV